MDSNRVAGKILLLLVLLNACSHSPREAALPVTDSTEEEVTPVITASLDAIDAKLQALTPREHSYAYDPVTHRVELHFHHAKPVNDKLRAVGQHLSHGVSYARKVFEQFPEIGVIDIVTTADFPDVTGLPRKEILMRHSFERRLFTTIDWEKVKGHPILEHVTRSSSRRGFIRHEFAQAQATTVSDSSVAQGRSEDPPPGTSSVDLDAVTYDD